MKFCFLNFVWQRGKETGFENPSRHKHKRCVQATLERVAVDKSHEWDRTYFDMEFQKYVDRILDKYKDGRVRHLFGVIRETIPELKGNDEQSIFVDYLTEEKLLTRAEGGYNEWEYKITPFGYKIITSDGWLKHLETIANEHNELIRLRQERESIERKRFWLNWIVAVAVVLLGVFGLYQTDRTNTLEQQLTKMTNQKDSTSSSADSLNRIIKTMDNELTERDETLDSLTNHLTPRK